MATHKIIIKPFEVIYDGNMAQQWLHWVERFKLYVDVMKITDEKDKINNLLLYGGDDVFDVYLPLKDGSDDFAAVLKKLTDHFNPTANSQVGVFRFRRCYQYPEEKFDEFVNRLRDLAKTCEFGAALDGELKTQLIQGSNSENFQTKAMEDSSLDLAGIIKLGRTVEVVSKQIQEMRKSQGCRLPDVEASVHQLKHIRVSKTPDNNYEPSNKECFNCGGPYPHEGQCPALGKTCNF